MTMNPLSGAGTLISCHEIWHKNCPCLIATAGSTNLGKEYWNLLHRRMAGKRPGSISILVPAPKLSLVDMKQTSKALISWDLRNIEAWITTSATSKIWLDVGHQRRRTIFWTSEKSAIQCMIAYRVGLLALVLTIQATNRPSFLPWQ